MQFIIFLMSWNNRGSADMPWCLVKWHLFVDVWLSSQKYCLTKALMWTFLFHLHMFFFFCENGPTSLSYAYTNSHLGAARHNRSSTISLRGLPQKLVGINCLAQGHFNGNCEGRVHVFLINFPVQILPNHLGKLNRPSLSSLFLVCMSYFVWISD